METVSAWPDGKNRDVPLAQVVVERCTDGANAMLFGHRGTAVQETVSTRNIVTWWLPTRCSPACSKQSAPSVPSSQPCFRKGGCGHAQKSTPTPTEQREESLQPLRKPPIKVHRRRPCASTTRSLRRRRKAWRTFKPKRQTRRKKEKRRALNSLVPKNGVVATRTATAQKIHLDETEAQVQEAEAAMARAKEEPAAKRRKTNTSECHESARAQAELDKAIDGAGRAVLGGKPAVGEVQPSQLSRGHGEPKFRILSAKISHLGPASRGGSAEC